ncbi:MAG: NADH-quinone oxidoreductase subunit C, partial [Actinomycetota bacterium]
LLGFVEAVKAAGFETFIDVCAVDHLNRDPRYDVVINLLSMQHAQRLIIKVGIPGDDPTVASISSIYAGANFYEREAWDLYGIVFEGHTDLTRLLLPDEWVGHPLRKDYSVGSVPVQFKGSHKST